MCSVTGQCPEHQKPGLLMASTPSLSLGVSGQPDHPLVANLRWLLDGISPLVSTEDRVHLDIWMQVNMCLYDESVCGYVMSLCGCFMRELLDGTSPLVSTDDGLHLDATKCVLIRDGSVGPVSRYRDHFTEIP